MDCPKLPQANFGEGESTKEEVVRVTKPYMQAAIKKHLSSALGFCAMKDDAIPNLIPSVFSIS